MGTWSPGPGPTDGNDVFTGDATDETADGGSGSDTLNGGGGNDTLNGSWGGDTLNGGPGDDTLNGGFIDSVSDTLIGGLGDDTYVVNYSAVDEIVELADEGIDRIVASGDWSLGANLENLSLEDIAYVDYYGNFYITAFMGVGNDLNNVITGGFGNNTLVGGPGADSLIGGEGWDTADYSSDSGGVLVDLEGGTATDGGGSSDTVSSIENVSGSEFADTLSGNAAANSLIGWAGDDSLDGGDGLDVLNGDGGDDTLNGGDGDDHLFGGTGADVLIGGAGTDRADYGGSSAAVSINLATGAGSGGDAAGDILNDIEDLVGSAWNDTLTGDGAGNYLQGGWGDDTLNGGDGADGLDGGPGNNTLNGGDGNDVLENTEGSIDTIQGGAGDDQIYHWFGHDDGVIDGGDGTDSLSIFGSQSSDILNATWNGSVLTNVAGNALTSIELVRADMPYADGSVDWLVYNASAAVVVDLSAGSASGFASVAGIENVIGGSGGDTLTGDGLDNRLDGQGGNDVLNGGAGDDRFAQTLDSGVDVIFGGDEGGDAGFDTIDYSAADGGVIVQLSGYATVSGGALLATFSGLEAAVGTDFADALIGNAANNRIEGGAGADWLVGQAGDDWFVQGIDASVDRLFGDAGSDTIDYGAASAGVVVQLIGWSTINGGALLATFTGMENVVGSAFNDALIGNASNNRITGGLGADWLVGQGGDDWFVQSIDTSSIDRLFGGLPGADSGVDTIDYSGASAGVVVQLSGYATNNFGGLSTTLATFSGIENAVGSAFNDALIGNALDNRITGGSAADWLVGQGGNDWFVQTNDPSSIDRLFGDAGTDTIDYSGASAGVTVQLSGYATSAGTTLATFTGIENAVGSAFNDALIGNASANSLIGGAGDDWLVGAAGADRFIYQGLASGVDTIADFSSADADAIDLSAIDANAALPGDQEFSFSALRTPGLFGEAVVANSANSSVVNLYLDADNIADMVIQVIHQPGVFMTADDFIL